MEWTCPHCQTLLAAPGTTAGTGQAYVRCAKCNGFAMLERGTGQVTKVDQPGKKPSPPPLKAVPTPPPYRFHPKVIEAEPAPPEPVIIPGPPMMREMPIAAYQGSSHRVPPFVSGLIVAGGAIAISFGAGNYLSSRLKTKVAVAQHTTEDSSPAVRASDAATRIKTTQAAPIQASSAAVIAAPRLASNEINESDSIHSTAMAPIRPEAPQQIKIYLQARSGVKILKLRSGPGEENPLIGLAKLDEQYPVIEWKNHWFKVSLDDEDARKTAWVHYDGIELLSDDGKPGDLRQ